MIYIDEYICQAYGECLVPDERVQGRGYRDALQCMNFQTAHIVFTCLLRELTIPRLALSGC
jgi:hypothetical protein